MQYGLAVDAARRIFLPSFVNSPRPRGAVNIYSLRNPRVPTSDYRRTKVIRGG